MASSSSATYRWRSCWVRSSSTTRTAASCSSSKAMSSTSTSGRMAPAALVRSNKRTLSSCALWLSRYSSSVGVSIHDAAHEAREGFPGIAFVSQGFLHGGYIDPETVGTEPPQEVLLAPIAAVQGTDAHPGPLGNGRDRGFRVGDENLAGGLQDQAVVARRLSPPATQ